MAAAYDTLTLATQNDILRLTTPNSGHSIAMDPFDHDFKFDADGLLDDVRSGLPPLQFIPSYELSDPFSNTFEDPFSYQSGPFENLIDSTNNHHDDADTSSQDHLDNKLLGFGAPIMKTAVLDDQGQTWPAMSAELYGMFFVAEDVFGGETAGRPMELTCYRRNLFQISGTVTLSRSIAHILNEQGQHVPIYDIVATLSALESIEGKSTEIISVPWKTSTVSTSEDKAGAAPPKWPLDLSMNPELDQQVVSIPIAWKRLQFKHATANNGRRKGLQQHYVIQINLMATLGTGDSVKLAEIQSGPIIVRGRSPRNFDSRKDVPLSERKLEPKQRQLSDPAPPAVKMDPAATFSATNAYRSYALNQLQQPLDLPDWTNVSPTLADPSQRQGKRPALSRNNSSNRAPVPQTQWAMENSSFAATNPSPVQAMAPIDLSLAEDENGRSNSQPNSARLGSSTSPQSGRKTMSSPIENADLLYEYFPLSVDDWMPPVDAIYRPHVVHHTAVPPEMKAARVNKKAKRYFSATEED